MAPTFTEALAQVEAATCADDLFAGAGDRAAAQRRYRQLARQLHPDTCPAPDRARASAGFARLADWWATWENRGSGGRDDETTIRTRRAVYTLTGTRTRGDLATLYGATSLDLRTPDAGPAPVLVKIPRSPANNDLLANEARVLTHLAGTVEPAHAAYLPHLAGSFRHRDTGTGTDRRVNALVPLDGFYSLAQVAAAHPAGLDARDVAWMWRRLLVALGLIHRAGVCHGAVIPEHVMIHPAQHGLTLVDFCYATTDDSPLTAVVGRRRDFYAPEVLDRVPPTPGSDLYAAARVAAHLMGPRAPRQLSAFVAGCTLTSPAARPDDAWALLAELDDLLERLYGPRRFRPFTMPTGATDPPGNQPGTN